MSKRQKEGLSCSFRLQLIKLTNYIMKILKNPKKRSTPAVDNYCASIMVSMILHIYFFKNYF